MKKVDAIRRVAERGSSELRLMGAWLHDAHPVTGAADHPSAATCTSRTHDSTPWWTRPSKTRPVTSTCPTAPTCARSSLRHTHGPAISSRTCSTHSLQPSQSRNCANARATSPRTIAREHHADLACDGLSSPTASSPTSSTPEHANSTWLTPNTSAPSSAKQRAHPITQARSKSRCSSFPDVLLAAGVSLTAERSPSPHKTRKAPSRGRGPCRRERLPPYSFNQISNQRRSLLFQGGARRGSVMSKDYRQ